MNLVDKRRIASVNRLRNLGWTYARIAQRKAFGTRDRLYRWLEARAVLIDGEWVPKDEITRKGDCREDCC